MVSYEYPAEWTDGAEAYYPINDEKNNALVEKYRQLLSARPDIIAGGRLGEYKYYDMDKVIEIALEKVEVEKNAAV